MGDNETDASNAPEGHEPPVSVDRQAAIPAPRLVLVAIGIAAVALTLGLFQDLGGIIAPVFLTVNLLIAASPVYTALVRLQAPRLVASIATGLTVFAALLLGVGALVWCATEMIGILSSYSTQFTELYQNTIALLGRFGFDQAALLSSLKSISPSSILNLAGSILSNASSLGAVVVVILTAMVFMMMDLPSLSERLRITAHVRPGLIQPIRNVVAGIRRYWLITTFFGLIVAVLDGLALVLLAVPLPLVWAVLCFISNYIPNVGFVIGLVPPALLGLFEGGPATAVTVVVVFSVINFILQSLIQPRITGNALGVIPTVSFLSLLLWAWVFGPLGALIALPATLTVKVMLIDPDPRLRWINALIGSDPKNALRT